MTKSGYKKLLGLEQDRKSPALLTERERKQRIKKNKDQVRANKNRILELERHIAKMKSIDLA